MSIESRRHQYGTVFDHWQIGELLGASKNGQTAVFHLQHKESSQEESAVKVITLIEEQGKLSEFSPRRKAEYEAELEKRKEHALKEVQFMYALKGYTNIVSYEDRVTEPWTESNCFGCDLLIRMELLRDLRKIIQTGHIFSEAETIQIGKDICTALILCHGEKDPIIHRDIKPENIFVNSRGTYKLGDFGISRILDKCQGGTATTAIGTPAYLAPEQKQKGYDERVDIYSLGLVLYELSNQNRLPFAESSYDTEKAILLRMSGNKLPEPCDASPALAKLILKACCFKPSGRFQSAQEMLDALNQLQCSTEQVPKKKQTKKSTSSATFATLPAEPNTKAISYATEPATIADNWSSIESLYSVVDKDFTQTLDRCQNGDSDAVLVLAQSYECGANGLCVSKDAAAHWYQESANNGSLDAMVLLGIHYYLGDAPTLGQNCKKAQALFLEASTKGDLFADFCLGYLLCYGGPGITTDYSQAIRHFLNAEEEYCIARVCIGDCYYYGYGVRRDRKTAKEWYDKYHTKGGTRSWDPLSTQVLLTLAKRYQKGQGVKRSTSRMSEIWELLAEAGHPEGLYKQGMRYAYHLSGHNYRKALACFEQAKDQGHKGALREYTKLVRRIARVGNIKYSPLVEHRHKEDFDIAINQYSKRVSKRENTRMFAGLAVILCAVIAGIVFWFVDINLPLVLYYTIFSTLCLTAVGLMATADIIAELKTYGFIDFEEIFAVLGWTFGPPLAVTILCLIIDGIIWICGTIF